MALRDIHFFSEDIDFTLRNKQKIRHWIARVIDQEGFRRIGELSFVFCSDPYLLEINRQYLDHDTYTDIVTFDSSHDRDTISGDIFISVDRTRENALKFGVGRTDELHRVMIHGVLHLCGYHDKNKDEKKLMRKKEDEALMIRGFD